MHNRLVSTAHLRGLSPRGSPWRASGAKASTCAICAITLALSIAEQPAAGRTPSAPPNKTRVALRAHDCKTTGTRVGKRQAVRVHIANISTREFFALDAKLERAIRLAHVGEYDGDGIGLDGSGADYFAYGPSAVLLWRTMKPIIAGASPTRGSYVVETYGAESAPRVKTTKCNLAPSS